ncbi:STAS/SEC14 domain-containing protein [Shewanella sp. AS1]|uniref:STAS/SEC14 domain-containing protein n=1 Tax=Shewanella sp. AS1 TaxID=2907626 RepID=UPI001F1C7672|nr:STAS/SEC14 domain-containing protein [Shewanella sp. AS1]MCE9677801.1 STAS/SEC14 domain-containing protein [Shewanella sp. AS1]
MKSDIHGLSIGIERWEKELFFVIKAYGRLTHEDYQYMTPLLESAIAEMKDPEILALMDLRELDGFSLHAAWDDLKLGLKHGKAFKKVAILGKGEFQQWMVRIVSWFTPGEYRFFDDKQQALSWLS